MEPYCHGCTYHGAEEDTCDRTGGRCRDGTGWLPSQKGFAYTCPKCGAIHGRPPGVIKALDIAMEDSNDCDCRLSARNYIIHIWRQYNLS